MKGRKKGRNGEREKEKKKGKQKEFCEHIDCTKLAIVYLHCNWPLSEYLHYVLSKCSISIFFFLLSPGETIVSHLPAQYWFYSSQCSYVWAIFEIALTLNGVVGEFLCEWTVGFSSNSTLPSLLPSFCTRPASLNIIIYIRHIVPEWYFEHIIFLLPYLILLFVWKVKVLVASVVADSLQPHRL